MKNKSKKPFVPPDRLETVRKHIMSALEEQPLTAKEISGIVSIPEKSVFNHLEHIQKTANRSGFILVTTPSECKKCGFVFIKREKLKKPGKCPKCRNETITQPVFSLQSK